MWKRLQKFFGTKDSLIYQQSYFDTLLLGYDFFSENEAYPANGSALDNTTNLYGDSWTLGTLERMGYKFSKQSATVLAEQNRIWLYPIAPVGALMHWLLNDNENELLKNCRAESLEAIRSKSAYLLIDYSYEGNGFQNHIGPIFSNLHRVLEKNAIPAHKVIFLFGNLIAKEKYKIWAFENKIENTINLFSVNFFEGSLFMDFKANPEQFLTLPQFFTQDPVARPKTFLSFNRQPHAHRIALGLSLFKKNILATGLFSFPPADYMNWNWDYWMKQTFEKKWAENLLAYEHSFKSLLPLKLDLDDLNKNPAFAQVQAASLQLYLESKFSVVTETTFHGENIFLSEKTFKPIVNLHPFIVVTHPHSLDKLKQLGYKTFHPWINEIYDCIVEPEKRLDAIIEEIERLANLQPFEWNQMWANIVPVLIHNKTLFERRGKASLHEIVNNIVSAIEKK